MIYKQQISLNFHHTVDHVTVPGGRTGGPTFVCSGSPSPLECAAWPGVSAGAPWVKHDVMGKCGHNAQHRPSINFLY